MYIILRSYQLLCPAMAPLVFSSRFSDCTKDILSTLKRFHCSSRTYLPLSSAKLGLKISLFKWCPSLMRWLAFSQACSTNSKSIPDCLYIGSIWCLNHGQSNLIHSAFCEIHLRNLLRASFRRCPNDLGPDTRCGSGGPWNWVTLWKIICKWRFSMAFDMKTCYKYSINGGFNR